MRTRIYAAPVVKGLKEGPWWFYVFFMNNQAKIIISILAP